jgi:hypothetical protein
LEYAYGAWIKVTLAEPSSSIVVRSEHQFNKHERRRLGLRKHFYEFSAQHRDSPSRERRGKNAWHFHVDKRFVSQLETNAAQAESADAQEAWTAMIGRLQELIGESFEDRAEFRDRLPLPVSDAGARIRELIASRAFSPADCYVIKSSDCFGHYVGFIDLRPNSFESPLALGVLGLPRRYRHNPDVRIVTGSYGPLFGGPAFAGTVYSMHDPKEGGAPCAQACAIMALGMLADRGAQISGNYTLTYLAYRKSAREHTHEDSIAAGDRHLGNGIPHGVTRFSFALRGETGNDKNAGLAPGELAQVLAERGISTLHIARPVNDGNRILMQRLIEAYITARFPIILAVDSAAWWPWRKHPRHAGHAVLVVGYRRLSNHPGEISLITHDPGYMPYYELPFADCQRACAQLRLRNGNPADKFHAILIAPESIRLHASECVSWLLAAEREFKPFFARNDDRDYRIALIVRDDLADRLYARPINPPQVRQFVSRLQAALEVSLDRCAYWCIAGFQQRRLRTVWLFDARKPIATAAGWTAQLTFQDRSVIMEFAREGGKRIDRVVIA